MKNNSNAPQSAQYDQVSKYHVYSRGLQIPLDWAQHRIYLTIFMEILRIFPAKEVPKTISPDIPRVVVGPGMVCMTGEIYDPFTARGACMIKLISKKKCVTDSMWCSIHRFGPIYADNNKPCPKAKRMARKSRLWESQAACKNENFLSKKRNGFKTCYYKFWITYGLYFDFFFRNSQIAHINGIMVVKGI